MVSLANVGLVFNTFLINFFEFLSKLMEKCSPDDVLVEYFNLNSAEAPWLLTQVPTLSVAVIVDPSGQSPTSPIVP